jgi:hypothetical protein
MAYGYEVRNPHDRKVVASKKILQLVSEKVAPGSLLVNEIPFCEYSSSRQRKYRPSSTLVRYIPEWLPWLSYKPLARYGYDLGQEVLHAPMEYVRETIVRILTFNDIIKVHFLLAGWHC